MPIRKLQDYWKTIERLEAAKGNKTQYTAIVKETGVSGLPICAASPAFSHPFFFPLDPFHLFYENCMPHMWDIWVSPASELERVHMSQDMASKLGLEAENAIATLPPSFCGPIRDIHKKRQSQYKIYEWMALLHWYIVPIAWELKFDFEVVKNFARFSNVVEYAMTPVPRTQDNLLKLYDQIVLFLRGFESLYVGNDPSKITRNRLCIFQLIHIPHHISYNGSVRFGSQATCERAIGDIGHGIRSKKSPFKNIASYKTDQQSARILHIFYPEFSSASGIKPPKTTLFTKIAITQKQRKEDENLQAQLQAAQSYLDRNSLPTAEFMRLGKCPLSKNVTLTSQLFELSKRHLSRSSRYFEAQVEKELQQGCQSEDDTELEIERIKPIFGEALAFYTAGSVSLVVYHPLIEHSRLFGRWYGTWSSEVLVLQTSAIVGLIGIWTYNNHVHILRKHPGLTLLSQEECGIDQEDHLII